MDLRLDDPDLRIRDLAYLLFLEELPVASGSSVGLASVGSSTPRVVPAGGDAQHTALRGHGIDRLVIAHEPEPFDGIDPVSLANQAVAFARISRSSFSYRFSRRRRRSSPRSSVVRPSLRRPSSRSAWPTQLRIAPAEGSNSRASTPARPHQLDHLPPELRWIRRMCSRHCGLLLSSSLLRYPRNRVNSTHSSGLSGSPVCG